MITAILLVYICGALFAAAQLLAQRERLSAELRPHWETSAAYEYLSYRAFVALSSFGYVLMWFIILPLKRKRRPAVVLPKHPDDDYMNAAYDLADAVSTENFHALLAAGMPPEAIRVALARRGHTVP